MRIVREYCVSWRYIGLLFGAVTFIWAATTRMDFGIFPVVMLLISTFSFSKRNRLAGVGISRPLTSGARSDEGGHRALTAVISASSLLLMTLGALLLAGLVLHGQDVSQVLSLNTAFILMIAAMMEMLGLEYVALNRRWVSA